MEKKTNKGNNKMNQNLLITLLSCTFIASCSSGTSFTHVGKVNAGRDFSVSGNKAKVDLSRSKISVGRDIDVCGENGIRVPDELTAPRDVRIGTGSCSNGSSDSLRSTVEEIKEKTDKLDIQERGGFTTVKPKSRSATVRMK